MWEELKRPATVLAVALLIISVIAGVATSTYFYRKSEKYANITYAIDQVQVFDKNALDKLPLTIRDHSGNIISENIYAASVTIWNSGNSEIKSNDVRETFYISIDAKSAKTVAITPVFYTRNNDDGFVIDTSTGKITWQYFDPLQGFKLVLIYTNPKLAKIVLKGYAVNTPIIDYTKLTLARIHQESVMNTIGLFDVAMLTAYCIIILILLLIRAARDLPDRDTNLVRFIKNYPLRMLRVTNLIGIFLGLVITIGIFVYFIGVPVGALPQKPF
jgi:hypothetical protein